MGGEANGGGGGELPKPVSAQTQALWLLAWLVNNIGITMLNKYAFSRAHFNYPLVVSSRMRSGCAGFFDWLFGRRA